MRLLIGILILSMNIIAATIGDTVFTGSCRSNYILYEIYASSTKCLDGPMNRVSFPGPAVDSAFELWCRAVPYNGSWRILLPDKFDRVSGLLYKYMYVTTMGWIAPATDTGRKYYLGDSISYTSIHIDYGIKQYRFSSFSPVAEFDTLIKQHLATAATVPIMPLNVNQTYLTGYFDLAGRRISVKGHVDVPYMLKIRKPCKKYQF